MKAFKTALFLWFFVGIPQWFFGQNIQVDDTYTAQQLVENVLIDSPCANVSNFAASGDTFSAGEQSYGYFTNTSPIFPFSNGVVLSTARAKRSEGPNNNLVDEGSTSWPGDQDLEQALGISHTYNATVLEFDFTPLTSQISFDYIFASEEYSGTAPCRYSDGFAFLLKPVGSADPYQNLAVLPNTNTPVLVTSVHPEISGSCPAVNEMYFGGFNDSAYPVNFNGQTVVMTAKATVIPGTTYHIKLVIADEENIRYDSAIFLGGGSFHVGTDIGPDRLFATDNPVCAGEIYSLDATELGSNTYQWFKNDNLIPGATSATYDVTAPGTYKVEIDLGGSGCIAEGEAVIEYAALPIVTTATLYQCDDNNDGVTYFNLNRADEIVTQGDATLLPVVYYLNLADAQSQANAVANATAFLSAPGSVIARVENNYGCVSFVTVNLEIANNSITAPTPIESCDNDGPEDGITAFNLETDVTPQISAMLPPGVAINYFASAEDAILNLSPLPDIFTNTTPSLQTIYAIVTNGPDCYGIIPVTLVVHSFDPGFADEDVFLCNGTPTTIGVPGGFTYVWNTGQITPSITITAGGSYSVTVTDGNGCSATKVFTVTDSQAAVIDDIVVSDFAGNGNTVRVTVAGNGDYEYSLFPGIWQSSNVFTAVPTGEYQVLVSDRNGCGTTTSEMVFVLDYPRFFTPNGDGYNDVWVVKNLFRRQAAIAIFDRYGKLLNHQDSDTYGWDGLYDGIPLPSTDYWFTITFDTGRIVKGHFSLKR